MHPSDKDVTTQAQATTFYSLTAYETLVGYYESHYDIHGVLIVFIGNYFGFASSWNIHVDVVRPK